MFAVLGYSLFRRGISRGKGTLEAESRLFRIVFTGTGPGLFFMAFGAIILITALLKGGVTQETTTKEPVAVVDSPTHIMEDPVSETKDTVTIHDPLRYRFDIFVYPPEVGDCRDDRIKVECVGPGAYDNLEQQLTEGVLKNQNLDDFCLVESSARDVWDSFAKDDRDVDAISKSGNGSLVIWKQLKTAKGRLTGFDNNDEFILMRKKVQD
ncbi:hypothetical protein ACFL5Q_04130 [Planctomycetota bacterium]